MKLLSGLALSCCLISLCACSTNGEKPKANFYKTLADTTGQNGRACFYVNDVRGFGTLDHDVMSVDAGRKYYLVTFLPGCNSLQTSPRAAFQSYIGGEACGGGLSKIHTREDSCSIRQAFEFKNQKEAFAAFDMAVKTYDASKAETPAQSGE